MSDSHSHSHAARRRRRSRRRSSSSSRSSSSLCAASIASRRRAICPLVGMVMAVGAESAGICGVMELLAGVPMG